jgi:lipopolysaccharide/colanic/teichoic acid biosynthesis glycosyltransferase
MARFLRRTTQSMTTLSHEPATITPLAFAHRLRAKRIPTSVRIVKRGIDLAAGLAGLAALVVLVPPIALAIRLESPGPVFYRQKRVRALRSRDAHGRCSFEEIEMLKFRTMRRDAEAPGRAVLAEENDPRVTRIGRLLRKSRLDELPQLWHVLTGEMSLVGPRPERPELLESLALAIPFFEERMHDCKPGLTGFAQISLGYSGHVPSDSPVSEFVASLTDPFHLAIDGSLADDMRMKLLYDLAYVAALERFRTYITLELMVIFKTPWVMLRGLGR